jgi:hypothetical protein
VGSGTARYRERESLLLGKIAALVAEVNEKPGICWSSANFSISSHPAAQNFFKAREPILL